MPDVAAHPAAAPRGHVAVASPNGRRRMTVRVTDGRLRYQVARRGRALVAPSGLGLDLARPALAHLRPATAVRAAQDDRREVAARVGIRRTRPQPRRGMRTADRATGDRATPGTWAPSPTNTTGP
ncbi:glycoside hydrolase family 97 N-terminal domain-containing protein [Streptomyces sp. NRRL F-5135]|uniref:glycoside hydrolase family 97 N-terminal domain-containing protein n=1 Tax=Streptomyces sp. NRRL F-5135 TaxID=1463858 RepID=UPI000D143B9E